MYFNKLGRPAFLDMVWFFFVQLSFVSISKPLRTASNMLCANLRVRIVGHMFGTERL